MKRTCYLHYFVSVYAAKLIGNEDSVNVAAIGAGAGAGVVVLISVSVAVAVLIWRRRYKI